MNLLKSVEKPLQPTVVDFLRAQECGFDQGYPKVCCYELPTEDLKKLKSNAKGSLNKLSADSLEMVTPITTKISENTKPSNSNHNVHNKDVILKKAFLGDYFDLNESFDLMIRIKRNDESDILDIEIR